MRAYLVCAIMFFALLFLAHMAHAQTKTPPPPQPAFSCFNGRQWKLVANTWTCPATPACARMCTYNAAAPASEKCVNDLRKNNFTQGVKGSGTPVPIDINDPDLYHVFIYGPSQTIDVTLQRASDGLSCNYQTRHYYGEWPTGDPRNLFPTAPAPAVAPVGVPVVTTLTTELLPYAKQIP